MTILPSVSPDAAITDTWIVSDLEPTAAACIDRIREILDAARARSLRAVNAAMVAAYWEIGREIVEEEQRGEARAKYGFRLLREVSARLTEEFGKGFSVSTLRSIRQFYLTYRSPPELPSSPSEIQHTPRVESAGSGSSTPDWIRSDLSWSHYRLLMKVQRPEARSFYEAECVKAGWTVRELERQICSLLYDRLSRSRDKEGVLALAREGHEVYQAADLVKDPYVLEFTGLPESSRWLESELEEALITRLQQFLLELGRDLHFVARQKRITIEGDHFYVDLVFYHRILRCFLLIDLKTGRLTQQDLGQMLLYTGYYEAEEMREDENPPIGLVLCTEKNEAAVQYALSKSAAQVFTSRYQLHLPTEAELAEEIRREREQLELQALDPGEDDG